MLTLRGDWLSMNQRQGIAFPRPLAHDVGHLLELAVTPWCG